MAKPIVDMFSWNAPGNTLQDLYNWYLEGGDEDVAYYVSAIARLSLLYDFGFNLLIISSFISLL